MTTKASSRGWIVPSKSSSLKVMGSRANFNLFSDDYMLEWPFTGTTVNAPFLLISVRLPGVAWMTSITPGRGGRGFPFCWVLCPAPRFLESTQTPLDTLLSLTAQGEPSVPNIARWYALYLCDKYNTSSGFFETSLPPSCSAIWSTVQP